MRLIACVLASSLCLAAQDPEPKARFDVRLAFGKGEFEHTTDGSGLDDETDGGMFRLAFEGVSKKGIGGGLRLEGIVSDDDLFVDAGFPASEAALSSLYLHFTYRAVAHRFAMPVRIGLMLEGYQLTEDATNDEVTYGSIGPYFEVAPEISLVAQRRFSWTIYAELGIGVAATGIEVENDSNDYVSSTAMFGAELGTRLRLGPVELGIGVVGRWRSMDESDVENGLVVLGYDAEFRGVLISAGVVF